ncbi:solute carrier family 35 member B1 [Trichonephila clavata]|uniref:Solute carrier family 35 member B1 n=1 Tax=Trichonephila clavata TaxID=2740835 RepID=A0A8X6FMJ9_TRICU|nr:solute carrier family 35 member B1 [Trichonephila clavata]
MKSDSIVIAADDPSKVTDDTPLAKNGKEVSVAPENRMSSNKRVICYAAGIFVCYFYFGILQEKITRSTYGDSDKFTYTATLVFVQCVVNCLFAKIIKFPSITKLPNPEQPVKHKVLHYIESAGPLVAVKLCHLALDRLKITKAEFPNTIRLGLMRLFRSN